MGRALFSQAYATPAVRTELSIDYEKWSRWNPFDPDSEEFFDNAQYEAFVDPVYPRDDDIVLEAAPGSPVSSDSSASDHDSPMAVGSDDPAIMIADAYSSVDWEHRLLIAGAANPEWQRTREERQPGESVRYPLSTLLFSPRSPRTGAEGAIGRVNRPRSATVSAVPAFLPPSSLRNSTTATEIDAELGSDPVRFPSLRRTVNITPINIPVEPSSPSPVEPSTPPLFVTPRVQPLMTPSPPPTATPRIYSWGQHSMPTSPSPPSAPQGSGLLTNPSARRSLARIPARARVQNTAV